MNVAADVGLLAAPPYNLDRAGLLAIPRRCLRWLAGEARRTAAESRARYARGMRNIFRPGNSESQKERKP